MFASVVPLLVKAEEVRREIPMPAPLYGVLAFVGFLLLLGVTWSFRNTAHKVRDRQGTSGGATSHESGAHH